MIKSTAVGGSGQDYLLCKMEELGMKKELAREEVSTFEEMYGENNRKQYEKSTIAYKMLKGDSEDLLYRP